MSNTFFASNISMTEEGREREREREEEEETELRNKISRKTCPEKLHCI